LRNILAHGHATSPAGEVFLRINNGSYQVGSWNGTNHFTSAAIPAGDLGQCVHLAGVYDPAAGQWRLYRNDEDNRMTRFESLVDGVDDYTHDHIAGGGCGPSPHLLAGWSGATSWSSSRAAPPEPATGKGCSRDLWSI
jgi:hypothetical protein